jgi:adenylate cyclase
MAWLGSAALVTAYMLNQEKKERALLMQLFSRHISPEVAKTIWQQRDQFMDGGRPRSQKLTATVLFTDLKGFTSVSEKMDPQALLEWLNVYMEAMAQLVMDHGGVVDDYLGDSIKANFGVPLSRITEADIGRDAMAAVNCALAMERELKRLNAVWQQQNLPTVEMRVGIFTGPVVAGSLGSTQRLKYTTVGDTVNIASRLESFDKELVDPDLADSPCRILIGETTLRYLDRQFQTKRVGDTNLKGKDEKVIIHRVIGRMEATSEL